MIIQDARASDAVQNAGKGRSEGGIIFHIQCKVNPKIAWTTGQMIAKIYGVKFVKLFSLNLK